MLKTRRQCLILLGSLTLLCTVPPQAFSQQVSYRKTGPTTADPADYSVSYGPSPKLPKNYDFYYYHRHYTPPPRAMAAPYMSAPRPMIGYVRPYSDVEYGKIVDELISSTDLAESTSSSTAATAAPTAPMASPVTALNASSQPDLVVQEQTSDVAQMTTGPALQTAVVDTVLDKGVLVTSSGVHIRLRGVQFPSITSRHPQRREIAARVLAALRDLTEGKRIYFVAEEPQYGHDGCLLAIVHLRDGTELNRMALESGIAILSPGDFLDEASADPLVDAETEARKAKRGFWAD